MEELAVLAEIEHSEQLTLTPTIYEAGIWRYCLYATGSILPFMKDTYNRVPVKANNIIIDQVEYDLCGSLEELRTLEESKDGWVNGGSIIYVRFPFFSPPNIFFSKKYGVLMGFTNVKPVLHENTAYRSGLLNAPTVEQSADTFVYDRMKFNSATVSVENTNGQFDDIGKLFGNEFNLSVAVKNEQEERRENLVVLAEDGVEERIITTGSKAVPEEYVVLGEEKQGEFSRVKMLAQYYIANIAVKLGNAVFQLKDKRERLSAKIPNRQFTEDELKAMGIEPKNADDIIDKDMQEAYGRCFGVPLVCLNGKQVYE